MFLITSLDPTEDTYLPLLMQQSVAALTGVLATRPLNFHHGDPMSLDSDELTMIGQALDKKTTELVGTDSSPEAWLEQLQNLCFSELDSRWAEFPEGVLEDYLRRHLDHHQRRLGITLD